MSQLKIIECKGFTKQEAFANLKFNPDHPAISGVNATQAWKKAGSPIPGTSEFKRFVIQQLSEKTKNTPGYGIHIVLKAPVQDTRIRPYTIINNKATSTRSWKFVYWIREDIIHINSELEKVLDEYGEDEETVETNVLSIVEQGNIVERCESKSEAIAKMKELTSKTHKSYSLLALKEPDIAPIAAYCLYTPSAGAKEGIFIACGINEEND